MATDGALTEFETERDERGHYRAFYTRSLPSHRAVVLLSGGMDSAVVLGLACWTYAEVHAIGFWYGQRHSNEIGYARELAKIAGVPFHLVNIDAGIWKQTALCGGSALPEGRTVHAIRDGGIPTSFVPGRNIVFLSHAIGLAGMLGGAHVLIGATKEDAAGYPDCRQEFLNAVSTMAQVALPLAAGQRISVRAPLVDLWKREVVALGRNMAIDFNRTWSCYQPRYEMSGVAPCERCDACVLRADALKQA